MPENDVPETELTLSTGKLLFLFFALVALCAVFFSLGYAVGRGNRESAPPITEASTTTPLAANASKPPAGSGTSQHAATQNPCPDGQPNCQATKPTGDTESSSDIVIKDKTPANNPLATNTAPPKTEPEPEEKPSVVSKPVDAAPSGNVAPSAGIMVQVAAVSKQADADALVNALRKKQYPVIVVNNVPGSTLYHVQVGPFSQQKDAEAMQKRLQADGYNAYIKK